MLASIACEHAEEIWLDNAKWIKEGDTWKPATAADRITWSQKGTKMDFYAYYPYNENVTDPAAIALDLGNQSSNIESADVLRAANTNGLATGEVTLSFDHILAMVNINAQELTADDDVVKISGVKTAATLNLGTGEIALSENELQELDEFISPLLKKQPNLEIDTSSILVVTYCNAPALTPIAKSLETLNSKDIKFK